MSVRVLGENRVAGKYGSANFRSIRIGQAIYTGGTDWGIYNEQASNRAVIGMNVWGAAWMDCVDNGMAFDYNGTQICAYNAGGFLMAGGANSGSNNSFQAWNLFSQRNPARVGIGLNSPQYTLEILQQQTTANTKNIVERHTNNSNVNGTFLQQVYCMNDDLNVVYSRTGWAAERIDSYRNAAMHWLSDSRYQTYQEIDPGAVVDAGHAFTPYIVSIHPNGNIGFQTRTPALGITLRNGLNIGIEMTGTVSNAPGTPTLTAQANEPTGTALIPGTTYDYFVTAVLTSGEETPPSGKLSVTDTSGPYTNNQYHNTITWTAPAATNTPIKNYRIYWRHTNHVSLSDPQYPMDYFQYTDTADNTTLSWTHAARVATNSVRYEPLPVTKEMATKISGTAPSWVYGSFGVGQCKDFGDGTNILGINNSLVPTVVPPSNVGWIFMDSGAIKGKTHSGTVTTLVAADPHCPECGRDFVFEAKNEKYGHLTICMWCLTDGMTKGIIRKDVA